MNLSEKRENLKIITAPNPILRQKSLPVGSFDKDLLNITNLLKNLLEQQKDPPGFGLSAVQIGILKQVFVARIADQIKPYVNPKILQTSAEKASFLEGCLSVPEFYGHVVRPAKIKLTAFSELGRKFTRWYSGISSRVIQHEIDHLNGILFIDHVHAQGGKLYKVVGKDDKGREQFAEIALT